MKFFSPWYFILAAAGLCERVNNLVVKNLGGANDQTKQGLAKEILDVDKRAKALQAEANLFFNNPGFQNKPPGKNNMENVWKTRILKLKFLDKIIPEIEQKW